MTTLGNAEQPEPGRAICANCKAAFSYKPMMLNGKEMCRPVICDPCGAKAKEREDREREEAQQAKIKSAWEAICPPLYRDTDPTRLPPPFVQVIIGWRYGPRGIGLVGAAGKGKTRAAFRILMRQHYGGRRCYAVSSTRLAMHAADQFADDPEAKRRARHALAMIRRCEILLLDDLGKARMTERTEMELFDILEHRTSHGLPTIWTANAGARELSDMLSLDRGDPILRRISEFSDIVTG